MLAARCASPSPAMPTTAARPIAPNATADGRAANRRVEIVIVAQPR